MTAAGRHALPVAQRGEEEAAEEELLGDRRDHGDEHADDDQRDRGVVGAELVGQRCRCVVDRRAPMTPASRGEHEERDVGDGDPAERRPEAASGAGRSADGRARRDRARARAPRRRSSADVLDDRRAMIDAGRRVRRASPPSAPRRSRRRTPRRSRRPKPAISATSAIHGGHGGHGRAARRAARGGGGALGQLGELRRCGRGGRRA